MNAAARRPKRVALYLRVSTSEQTTRNQRRELKAVAERHGWEIVKVFEDAGVSGGKGRDERPGLDELLRRSPGARSTWWRRGRSTGSDAA